MILILILCKINKIGIASAVIGFVALVIGYLTLRHMRDERREKKEAERVQAQAEGRVGHEMQGR